MKIIVNGKDQIVESAKIGLLEFIQQNNAKEPSMVSIQVYGEFIDRNNFAVTDINENDEVDFLYFMEGGRYA